MPNDGSIDRMHQLMPAAPDRPGDRDQQQAAEDVDSLAAWLVAHYGSLLRPPNDMGDGKSDAKRLVAYLHKTGVIAAARAEEAARWQAKIAALIEQADRQPDGLRGLVTTRVLRAVLDASTRATDQPLGDETTPAGTSTARERDEFRHERNQEDA